MLESSKTLPLAFGNTICLSAVGSTTCKVVSCASAVVPSNLINPVAESLKVILVLQCKEIPLVSAECFPPKRL